MTNRSVFLTNMIKAITIASCFCLFASLLNLAVQIIEKWSLGVQYTTNFNITCSGPLLYSILLFLSISIKPILKISTSIDYILPDLVLVLSIILILIGFGEGVDILATGTFIMVHFLSIMSSRFIDTWSNYNLRIFSYYFVIDTLLVYILQVLLIKASRFTCEKYILTKEKFN
jgi:hypothetical protein